MAEWKKKRWDSDVAYKKSLDWKFISERACMFKTKQASKQAAIQKHIKSKGWQLWMCEWAKLLIYLNWWESRKWCTTVNKKGDGVDYCLHFCKHSTATIRVNFSYLYLYYLLFFGGDVF